MITLSTSGGNFPGNRDLIDGIFCISLNIILVMVKIKTPFVLLIVECTRRTTGFLLGERFLTLCLAYPGTLGGKT